MNIRTTWKWIALALVAGGMLAVTPAAPAAATPKERAVWPPAPSEPRIAFVQFITGPGEFNYPTSVAVDGRGHLVVSDTLNCRVQVFDMRGKFLSQFGGNGDTSGHFSRPKGVAVDAAGNIYVVDALFDNFQIFNLAGQLLLNVGETGTQPGGFGLPNGIAIGADNRIYVADTFNHRVQVFQYLGQP